MQAYLKRLRTCWTYRFNKKPPTNAFMAPKGALGRAVIAAPDGWLSVKPKPIKRIRVMQTFTILDHAPVSRVDYSVIAATLRDINITEEPGEKIEFVAGTYKLRCKATIDAVSHLAEKIAKHGTKEKQAKRYTLAPAKEQEYASIGKEGTLHPIKMETGGKYRYVRVTGIDCYFIVHKKVDAPTYAVTACGTGLYIGNNKPARNPEQAIDAFFEWLERAAKNTQGISIQAKIEACKVEHAARLAKEGL